MVGLQVLAMEMKNMCLQQFVVCLICMLACNNTCSYSLEVKCIFYSRQIDLFVSLGQTILSVPAAENVATLCLC